MTIFGWRMLVIISLIVFAFNIATIVLTLLLVFDIKAGVKLNMSIVTFVEAANLIFASLIFLSIVFAMGLSPVYLYYRKQARSVLATGLKSAP